MFGELNYRVYIAMILPFMLAICSIRNLRYLSPFSVVANVLQFVGLGIIFYYIFATPLPDSSSVPWLAESSRLPLFFGTAIFAIEGISVVRHSSKTFNRQDLGYFCSLLRCCQSRTRCGHRGTCYPPTES